jgi:adenylosuccinate synthase
MVYTQKNKDLATMNKIRVNSDAPQGQAVPAPPIVPSFFQKCTMKGQNSNWSTTSTSANTADILHVPSKLKNYVNHAQANIFVPIELFQETQANNRCAIQTNEHKNVNKD